MQIYPAPVRESGTSHATEQLTSGVKRVNFRENAQQERRSHLALSAWSSGPACTAVGAASVDGLYVYRDSNSFTAIR